MNKIFKFLIIAILSLITFSIFSQSGSVRDIVIASNDNNVIRFNILDVSVTKMKNKDVFFAFKLFQKGKSLESTYLTFSEQTVMYDPCYWNGEAFWVEYSYSDIMNAGGNLSDAFKGTFFIMDSYTGKSIYKKDISFNLNYSDNSNNKNGEVNNMNSSYNDVVIEYGESDGYSITISDGMIYEKNPTGNTIQMDNNPLSSNYIMESSSKEAPINDTDIKQLIDIFYKNNWKSLSSKIDSMDRYDYIWLRLKDSKGDKSVQIGTSKMSGNVIPAEMKTIISFMKSLAKKYIK